MTDLPNRCGGMQRRGAVRALAAAVAAPTALWLSRAHAADFPSGPITLIVPWPPGGPIDTLVRSLAAAAGKQLGQPLVIVNRPGASGTLGIAGMVANAKPDGYTISQMSISALRLPHMQQVSYDPLKDFTFIIGVSGFATGIIVRADSPWKSFKDMIDQAKAQPGSVTYATTGQGTTLHLAMEEVSRITGAKMLHVPYKGTAETTVALMGGQAMMQLDSVGLPMVRAGQARVLATFTQERYPKLPQVPTVRELGVDVVANSPLGYIGPKGMDPAVVKVLHDALRKAMDDPDYKAVADQNAQETWYRSSADYQRWAVEASATEARVLKALGMAK